MDSRYIYHWKKTCNYVWGHSPFWDPKSCHVEQNPIDLPWTSHEFPMNSLSFASEIPRPLTYRVPPRPPKPSRRQPMWCCDVVMFPRKPGGYFFGDLFRPTKWARCPKHIMFFPDFFVGRCLDGSWKIWSSRGSQDDFRSVLSRHEESPCNWDGLRVKNCQNGWFWPEVTIL
jgi:hypothetical protein